MKVYPGIALSVALAALLLSGAVHAQATFICGSSACSDAGAFSGVGPLPTGIDNLVVDGKTYDMTFSSTQGTTFSAQTGIDAAVAINAFFNTQVIPDPDATFGPGFNYSIHGHFSAMGDFIETARGTSFTDFTEPYLDGNYLGLPPTNGVFQIPSVLACSSGVVCTTWTQVKTSAPELDASSPASALTLLMGVLAVALGRVKNIKVPA